MEFRVEVSPSGRSSCRGCKEKIGKGELRLAEEYTNAFSAETAWRYWHLPCAAKKLPSELQGALKAWPDEVPDRASLEQQIAAASSKVKPKLDLPHADRAPTGRAKCMSCSQPLEKGALRVAVERELDTPMGTQKGPGYLHPRCAVNWVRFQIDDGSSEWESTEDFVAAVLGNSGLSEADAAELGSQLT